MKLFPESHYMPMIEQADRALAAGQYQEAVQLYREAIYRYQQEHQTPNYAISTALCSMGISLYHQGHLKPAHDRLQEGCRYLVEELLSQKRGRPDDAERLIEAFRYLARSQKNLGYEESYQSTVHTATRLALTLLGPDNPQVIAFLKDNPQSTDRTKIALHTDQKQDSTKPADTIPYAPALQTIAMLLNQEPTDVTKTNEHDSIPMTDEDVAMVKRLQVEFQNKFGRPMGKTDPLFFNPFASSPQTAVILELL